MLFSELEQLSVSLPMSAAPPMLSPFRPVLSPAHPIPSSVERVFVQQLNLVFRTSKPAQKESVRLERTFFSCHPSSLASGNEHIGAGLMSKEC